MAKDKQNTWFCLLLFICTCRYKECMHCIKCLIIYIFLLNFFIKNLYKNFLIPHLVIQRHFVCAAALVRLCCCGTRCRCPAGATAHESWGHWLWGATARSSDPLGRQRAKVSERRVFPAQAECRTWTVGVVAAAAGNSAYPDRSASLHLQSTVL